MRHWKRGFLVAISIFGLTACGGNKKTDLASLKKTEEFKACTVNTNGTSCIDEKKKGCNAADFKTLQEKINALPKTEERPKACAKEMSVADALSNAHAAMDKSFEQWPHQSEITAAKAWKKKVEKFPNVNKCVITDEKQKAGYCLAFAKTGCTKDITEKLFSKDNYDPSKFSPEPCAVNEENASSSAKGSPVADLEKNINAGLDRGVYSPVLKAGVNKFLPVVDDAIKIKDMMTSGLSDEPLTQEKRVMLTQFHTDIKNALNDSEYINKLKLLNSNRADIKNYIFAMTEFNKMTPLVNAGFKAIFAADDMNKAKSDLEKAESAGKATPAMRENLKNKKSELQDAARELMTEMARLRPEMKKLHEIASHNR
jgi:hypothetical protein